MRTRSEMGFLENESGAVTVDWVVLTATIVLLGAGVGLAVSPAVQNLSSDIAGFLDDYAEQMESGSF